MVTRFVQKTYNGEAQSFAEFALDCVGGLPMFHSLDGRPAPEEFVADTSLDVRALEATAELTRATNAMTDAEWEALAEEDHAKRLQLREEMAAEATAARKRLERRIAEVRAWQAPTPDHESLRALMLEQLESVMKTDCDPYIAYDPPVRLTGAQFKELQMENLRSITANRAEMMERESAKAQRKTAWIRALRASLQQPASAPDETQ